MRLLLAVPLKTERHLTEKLYKNMEKNTVIRSLRINYFVSFVAALLVLLAFELDFIEKGALVKVMSSTAMYIVQVVAVMITVIFIPCAIKGFTKSMEKSKGMPENGILDVFCKKSLLRIFLLFVVVLVNLFVYYGLGYDSALYCGLLGFGSMIYSFPTKMVLEQYIEGKEN